MVYESIWKRILNIVGPVIVSVRGWSFVSVGAVVVPVWASRARGFVMEMLVMMRFKSFPVVILVVFGGRTAMLYVGV